MIDRLKLQAKLILMTAVTTAILALLGSVGVYKMNQMATEMQRGLRTAKNENAAMIAIESAQMHFKIQIQEWKNILIRGNSPENFDKYLTQFGEEEKKVQAFLMTAEVMVKELNIDTKPIAQLKIDHAALGVKYREALTHFDKSDQNAGKIVDKLVKGMDRSTSTGMEKVVGNIEQHFSELIDSSIKDGENTYKAACVAFIAIMTSGLAVAFTLSIMVLRSIMRQLGGEPAYAHKVAQTIAAGDLSLSIRTNFGDNTSVLAAIDAMQNELKSIIAEITDLVDRAKNGDFTHRITTAGKTGFGLEIGESLNALMQTINEGLTDITAVSQALSNGDLSQTISKRYSGQFECTVGSINRTVSVLNEVIADIRRIVDTAAEGDFRQSIDTTDKQGYVKTLAELLNRLNRRAHSALSDIAQAAQNIAQGNLTQRIENKHPGMFGETAEAINVTVEHFRSIVGKIQEASAAVNTAADEIASGNAGLTKRIEEQASSLEETASSMEELNSTVKQNSENALVANTHAKESAETAIKGGEMVKRIVDTMNLIQDSSRQMANIVGIIDSIAFHTNLLSLNAAVEAARAGEQGRGFAVVASEVRILSQRSSTSAKEIKALIDETLSKVANGGALVAEAGEMMDKVVESFQTVATLVTDIANSSHEQSSGIEQITAAVGQMDDMTQQNAALVEEVAATAESLTEQARDLVRAVEIFRL